MEKNEKYIELYKFIEKNSNIFTSLTNQASNSLNSVSTSMTEMIESLRNTEVWDDSISKEITENLENGVMQNLNICNKPLEGTGKIDGVLYATSGALEQYDKLVDRYNECDQKCGKTVPATRISHKEYPKNEFGEEDKNGDYIIVFEDNPEYKEYLKTKAEMKDIEDSIVVYSEAIDLNFQQLHDILNEVGTSAYSAAVGANAIEIKTKEIDIDPSEYGYDSDKYFGKKIIRSRGDGSGLVMEVYCIYNKEGGQLVESSNYHYIDGEVKEIIIHKTPDNPTESIDSPEEVLDEETVPVEETAVIKIDEVDLSKVLPSLPTLSKDNKLAGILMTSVVDFALKNGALGSSKESNESVETSEETISNENVSDEDLETAKAIINEEISEDDVTSEESIDETNEDVDLSLESQALLTPEVGEKIENYATEHDGQTVKVTGKDSKHFADGSSSEITSEYLGVKVENGEGNGVIDGADNVVAFTESSNGEVEVDGKTFDYQKQTIYTQNGNVEVSHEELTNDDGATVWTEDAKMVTEYDDNTTGASVYSGVTTGENEDMTIITSEKTWTVDGDTALTKTEEVQVSKSDPEVGIYTAEDGIMYEYKRDDSDNLIEITSYIDDSGNKVETSSRTIDQDICIFTIIEPDGSMTEMEVNYNSQLSMQRVGAAYKLAMEDCGYSVDYDLEGIHALYWCDGDDVTVEGNSKTYTFNLRPKE